MENAKMANVQSTRARRFTEVFDAAERIPFMLEWSNGTGYFDFAVRSGKQENLHVPDIPVGEVRGSITPSNRRLLFVSTHLGHVVISDRYSDGDGEVFVTNQDDRLRAGRWIDHGAVSDDNMLFILGFGGVGNSIRGGIADVVSEVRSLIKAELKGKLK